jgi:hypothetical protein
MLQATLVSLYGEKDHGLGTLIRKCQEVLQDTVGGAFRPYDVSQVHATIFGLERKVSSARLNSNFLKYRGRETEMDFDGLAEFLRSSENLPLYIQIGGFDKRDYPFTSRQLTPYERSFSIQGDKVVLMGWPVRGTPFLIPPTTPQLWVQEAQLYPRTLDKLRRRAQNFGVLHAYHRAFSDVDNDLFFRIGLIDPPLGDTRTMLESRIRDYLRVQPPLTVEVRADQICVAIYQDDTLPASTTKTLSLSELTAIHLISLLEMS